MPGPVGRAVRDIMLRLIFRDVITEKSLAWMYDYRVDQGRATARLAGNPDRHPAKGV